MSMHPLSKFLTILFVIVLALGQFARVPGLAERVYLFDLFAPCFAFYSVLIFAKSHTKFRLDIVSFSFVAFSVWAFLSLIRGNVIGGYGDFVLQLFYLIRWVSYLISALGIVHMVKIKYLDYNWLLKCLMFVGSFLSLAGFLQLVLLPDFTVLSSEYGWDPHKNRLASTFFDPNFLGAFLVCSITIYLGLVCDKKLSIRSNYLHTVFFFLVPLSALFLTFSRSAWGMFALVILVLGLLKYRLLLIAFVFISILVYFAVPRVQTRISGITDPADSAQFRVVSWGNALKVAQSSPFFGVGFNSYRYAQKEMGFFKAGSLGGNSGAGADSSILFILATSGIIGLFTFTLGYFTGVVRAFRYRNHGGLTAFAILIALFFESTFINSFFYPQILLLWLIFALLPYQASRFGILR